LQEDKKQMADSKNEEYLYYLDMDQSELLPGFINAALLKKKTNRLLWDQPAKMQDLFWRKRESDIILLL
jgi:hypothetical protein